MSYIIFLMIYTTAIVLITGSFQDRSIVYDSPFFGVIEDIYYGNRSPSFAIIKFKGTDKFNKSFNLKVPESARDKLLKNDSIFKPMFSNQAYVYKNDSLILILNVK